MVLDTSALVAILSQEPEAQALALAIDEHPCRCVSAATVLEASIVIAVRFGEPGLRDLDQLLAKILAEVVPVSADQAALGRQAFLKYGKGRHPAGLNYGDCFAYALTKTSGQPLLCKGDDFARTDLALVPLPLH